MQQSDTGYHYQLMRRAIDIIDQHDGAITLENLAREMGMSVAHFQRLFSNWVGVSPKKYQQYLALSHAKTLLSARFTLLETAYLSGLSGTGRLHDLFVRWEAMTPGEFARQADDVTIQWGWFATPFGEALAMGTQRGLCGLAFVEEIGREQALSDMMARWPSARYVPYAGGGLARQSEGLSGELPDWVDAAFLARGETPLSLIGAPFQIKVWEALMHIPSGFVTSYSQIASAIGHPKAVRAVGTAVGRNPVSWVIPCHRALRKSGGLGGYHWGLRVKRAMLAYEAARQEA
ncbi:bifunctional helix-turn-helix domain-containing protein/methylated-DNA--[protein]-cysteine S-methyltransferase [Paracoccaceae bacterium]|nr:bifunctional helix-turn-helix domain-containing protein/methylated-DNA--[protein]-cysteine S-methyltransferase [Paracoccaceae bacterium]